MSTISGMMVPLRERKHSAMFALTLSTRRQNARSLTKETT
jgi:hypothetical protein